MTVTFTALGRQALVFQNRPHLAIHGLRALFISQSRGLKYASNQKRLPGQETGTQAELQRRLYTAWFCFLGLLPRVSPSKKAGGPRIVFWVWALPLASPATLRSS